MWSPPVSRASLIDVYISGLNLTAVAIAFFEFIDALPKIDR
jgi:hypothetical protein